MGSSLGVEAIGEFQTLTNTYTAQFGGNGGVINAVSKSGSNNFHGSALRILRNSDLDARQFIDPAHRHPRLSARISTAAAWAVLSSTTRPSSS